MNIRKTTPADLDRILTVYADARRRMSESGNGETLACGTGACAAVVAACENGLCEKGVDIWVKLAGGDLIVNNTNGFLTLTGSAVLVYEGVFEY